MKHIAMVAVVLLITLTGFTMAQDKTELYNENEGDKAAVKEAVLDYVEAIYEIDPSRIERSVHPELAKRGFYIDNGYQEVPMTFDQLVDLAGKYNKDGKIPDDAPKEVEILDLLDKTASVKLTAHWGIDYMHLAKYDGKWMIVNVLWQSPPPKATSQSNAQLIKVGYGGGMTANDHGVEMIRLEKGRCLGACPVYSVTIKSDGTFRYEGKENVKMVGKYKGTVSKWSYNQLASFINDSGYMQWESSYKNTM